eukprot:2728501-Pleurochrysis_carterae.AAC.2
MQAEGATVELGAAVLMGVQGGNPLAALCRASAMAKRQSRKKHADFSAERARRAREGRYSHTYVRRSGLVRSSWKSFLVPFVAGPIGCLPDPTFA